MALEALCFRVVRPSVRAFGRDILGLVGHRLLVYVGGGHQGGYGLLKLTRHDRA